MSTLFARSVAVASLLVASTTCAQAKPEPNLAWMREYAIPYTTSETSPVKAKVPEQMNLSPRFLPTLRAAFPQRQWFWRDEGKMFPVADVAQEYLAVPSRSWNLGGSAWSDDNRFVTEEGCVPHVCGPDGDNGMLWAETAASRHWLIFAATKIVAVRSGPYAHLWLFSSRALNFQQAPAEFMTSLQRWMEQGNVTKASTVRLVTIVQPTGEQVDLDLASLQAERK